MFKKFSFAIAALAISATAVMAQTALTSQEKAACRPDAIKLCSASIGKPTEMNQCLVQNKANLSAACLAVVKAHGG